MSGILGAMSVEIDEIRRLETWMKKMGIAFEKAA